MWLVGQLGHVEKERIACRPVQKTPTMTIVRGRFAKIEPERWRSFVEPDHLKTFCEDALDTRRCGRRGPARWHACRGRVRARDRASRFRPAGDRWEWWLLWHAGRPIF